MQSKTFSPNETLENNIRHAVEVFRELKVFHRDQWEQNILRIANQELAKARLPWTKRYWERRIACDDLINKHGSYYNAPWFQPWGDDRLAQAESLQRRYSCAVKDCEAIEVSLNNKELDLLSYDVTAAKQIISGEKTH